MTMVVDRNMEEQAKVIFNGNLKTLSNLLNSAFVGVRTVKVLVMQFTEAHTTPSFVRSKCVLSSIYFLLIAWDSGV